MKFSLLLLLASFGAVSRPLPPDEALSRLKHALAERPQALLARQRLLGRLLTEKGKSRGALMIYHANERLAEAYANYKVDSAAWYLEQNLLIAGALRRASLSRSTAIRLSVFDALLGKFWEAEHLLDTIRVATLDKQERSRYYWAYQQYLGYYAVNTATAYSGQINRYRSLSLSLMDTATAAYHTGLGEQLLDEGKLDKARQVLLGWFSRIRREDGSYARTAYLLGNTFTRLHDRTAAKSYFTLSAIAELNGAMKANASLQKLATIYYYGEGDLDMAHELTKCALEDAMFSNVRFRMFQVAKFSEEVTNAYQAKELQQKHWLIWLLGLISLLTLLAGSAAVVIRRQKKNAECARNELALLNRQLAESGRIKEAYISNFFEWCSAYIDKLTAYRKKLLKKAMNKQGDELIAVLKSDALEKQEVAELYRTFDMVFLNIYPDFIEAFHALLTTGESVWPKEGELLSPMLRVFALIRLGITDSAKIAAFLRYSPSTVYNFRTKGRNMALGKREEFEAAVMQIGEVA